MSFYLSQNCLIFGLETGLLQNLNSCRKKNIKQYCITLIILHSLTSQANLFCPKEIIALEKNTYLK